MEYKKEKVIQSHDKRLVHNYKALYEIICAKKNNNVRTGEDKL